MTTKKIQKILAIKLRALGDTVLLTAPLLKLKEHFPESEIHVLVPKSWAPILENHPAVHRIWTRAGTKTGIRLAYHLRREKFDCVLNFHASPSSAFLARLTGAPIRSIHFHGHHHPNRYSTVVIPDKGILKPIIERDMDTIRAILPNETEQKNFDQNRAESRITPDKKSSPKLKYPEKGQDGLLGEGAGPWMAPSILRNLFLSGVSPTVYLTREEKEWAKNYLSQLNLTPPILGLHLSASRPTKMWPIESFAQLALRWCEQKNGSVLAFVGPNEEHLLTSLRHSITNLKANKHQTDVEPGQNKFSKIEVPPKGPGWPFGGRGRAMDGPFNFAELILPGLNICTAHNLPLRHLAAVLQQLQVVAGGDSGPKHLAIAVGTPTVTLFGPEHPFEWHPYPLDKNPYLFIDNLPCRRDAHPGYPPWCALQECIIEKHKCMRSLSVDAVFNLCQKVIS